MEIAVEIDKVWVVSDEYDDKVVTEEEASALLQQYGKYFAFEDK